MTSTHELGPLEMEVLGLLDRLGPQSVTEVQTLLAKKGRELAYTTVMTVLSRLHDKGALTRTKEGKRFLYSPARGYGKIKRGVLKRIQAALFQGHGGSPVTALLDAEDLTSAELLVLKSWVNARLRERGE